MENSVKTDIAKEIAPNQLENQAETQGVAAVSEATKKRTIGNKIYDIPVFGGIAWGGVSLLSALSAHESMYGKNKYFNWLRTVNDVVFKGLRSNFGKTILKNAPQETVDAYAKGTTMFVTLGMGGNALALPIWWMENNRQKNAAKIDKLLGTTPPDPETIANEPQQTLGSVGKGRLISWGGSYAAFLAMGPKLVGKINDFCGEKATAAWMNLKPKANPAGVRKWADIAAFDALFTAITASVTYIFSRYFAQKEHRKIDAEDEIFEINPAVPHAFTREFDEHDKKHSFAEKHPRKNKEKTEAPIPLIDRAITANNSVNTIG